MISKNTKKYITKKKEKNLYGFRSIPPAHPGETLKDEINFFGLTQAEIATRVGCTVQTINRIINNKEPIRSDIALKLERAFEGRPSAQFWLNMQIAYDTEVALMKEKKKTGGEISFFKKYLKETYQELCRKSFCKKIVLNKDDDFVEAILSMKSFFEVSSLENIRDKNILGVAFRKYDRKNLNEYNLAAILQAGEREARKALKNSSLKEYDGKLFLSELPKLRHLTQKRPAVFLKELQEKCYRFGVIVVYVPNMKHTYFGGATTWIGNHPVIMLKKENQWEDTFWFNFFHEAGHILKHSKKKAFVDFNEEKREDVAEKDADDFAQKMLIPGFNEIASNIKVDDNIEMWIKKSARHVGVSESVIAGRICKVIGKNDIWKKLNKLRPTIKENIKA